MQVTGNATVGNQASVNDRVVAAVGGKDLPKGQAEASQQQLGVSESSPADLLKQGGADVNFQLSFSIDKDSKELVVKVINPVTNEVIRQIPPQELLNLAASLQQTAGILINKQV